MLEKEELNLVAYLLQASLLHEKPYDMGWKSDYKLTYTQDERNAMIRLLGKINEHLSSM